MTAVSKNNAVSTSNRAVLSPSPHITLRSPLPQFFHSLSRRVMPHRSHHPLSHSTIVFSQIPSIIPHLSQRNNETDQKPPHRRRDQRIRPRPHLRRRQDNPTEALCQGIESEVSLFAHHHCKLSTCHSRTKVKTFTPSLPTSSSVNPLSSRFSSYKFTPTLTLPH